MIFQGWFLFLRFCSQFVKVTSSIYDMGLARKLERDEEEKQFVHCIQMAKDEAENERKVIMADFFLEKDQYFKKVVSLMESLEDSQGIKPEVNAVDGPKHKPTSSLTEVEEEESEEYEVMGQIQNLNFDFSDLCQKILETLMSMEMHLYEQIEETLANYERKITDLVNNFLESAQALFVSCRSLQTNFSEQLATVVPRFFNVTRARIAASKEIKQDIESVNIEQQENCFSIVPKILEECLESTDALQNAIASSHDIHVQMIDAREDKLISEAKNWLKENLSEHSRYEIQGNRERLYEIITVINKVKEEFEELQASLVTLPMLADMEIIDE
ncbi:hypothetical protein J437_LFUL015761 [Ladona fulva]|uniref:Uncharacterized protein n=1 Tax=Ladona fulva TaxID=123851 RepID=A0A8K0KKK6_LADFU|nr:hypothetical protein J437_LFUL015761 [Ladona fulva]